MIFIKPGTASILAFYYFFFQKKSRFFGLLATVIGNGSSTPTLQGSYVIQFFWIIGDLIFMALQAAVLFQSGWLKMLLFVG